ncbi:MAG: tail fiber domain-containing protein [Flavobacteriales bacterium]|nr:tail fiber domain-containing protein [Flavobacteriales bacterium]
MREGLSGSRDLDFFYTGLIADPVNGTLRDAGAVWSRDASIGQGPGLYKFIYTGADGSSNTASGANGLEMGRFQPDVSLDEGYFGLGDWTTAAAAPTERLDLLNGKVRVRSLPTDAVSTSTEMVTVNMTNGVIEHRPIANLPDNCEWSMSTTAPNNVYTAVGASSPSCPDVDDKVGIGVTTMNAKLHVFANTTNIPVAGLFDSDLASSSTTGLVAYSGRYTTGPVRTGLDVVAKGGTTTTTAASVTAETSTTTATNRGLVASANVVGVSGAATNNRAGEFNTFGPATSSVGVWSRTAAATATNDAGFFQALAGATATYGLRAYGQGTGTSSYGVYALANQAATTNYGIRAGASNGTNNWAGWFDGNVNIQSGGLYINTVFQLSDANLKQNVEPLLNASSVLAQLSPETYSFIQGVHPDLELPTGDHMGFLAQDVEVVLPGLVSNVTIPAAFDSLGNQVAMEMPVKALDYVSIIPLLVAAMQEQNARIDQLQQQLDQCCDAGAFDGHSMQQGAGSSGGGTLETDLRIVPNPVAASTQLLYTVGTPGRIRLEVTDNTGRVIEVLEEATRITGSFTYEWNTQQLAAGTYFCTLYVNDEPLVKKAVKLNER